LGVLLKECSNISQKTLPVGKIIKHEIFTVNKLFNLAGFVTILLGVLAWLPAIMQKNQLSIVGAIWSVMSLLATVLIGLLIFGEKLNVIGIIGVVAVMVAVALLSLN